MVEARTAAAGGANGGSMHSTLNSTLRSTLSTTTRERMKGGGVGAALGFGGGGGAAAPALGGSRRQSSMRQPAAIPRTHLSSGSRGGAVAEKVGSIGGRSAARAAPPAAPTAGVANIGHNDAGVQRPQKKIFAANKAAGAAPFAQDSMNRPPSAPAAHRRPTPVASPARPRVPPPPRLVPKPVRRPATTSKSVWDNAAPYKPPPPAKPPRSAKRTGTNPSTPMKANRGPVRPASAQPSAVARRAQQQEQQSRQAIPLMPEPFGESTDSFGARSVETGSQRRRLFGQNTAVPSSSTARGQKHQEMAHQRASAVDTEHGSPEPLVKVQPPELPDDQSRKGDFFSRLRGRGGEASPREEVEQQTQYRASEQQQQPGNWPSGLHPGEGQHLKPEDVTVAQLQQLERTLRDTLRDKRSVYESGKDMLARHFREVDDGSGDVDVREFCAIWSRLGVEVSVAEATALFKKHGFAKGVIPYKRFMELLLKSPSRSLTEGTVKKGAFNLTGPFTHNGKILYPQCRKGVYPPSDWTKELGARSAELPSAALKLEFVYGYAGVHNTSSNLFYLNSGELVYYTAAVAIVYNRQKHTQRFFLGHVDDIRSLCVCPVAIGVHADSGNPNSTKVKYEKRTLVATGQIMTEDCDPYVSIWDSTKVGTSEDESAEVRRLTFPKESHGICSLQFSHDARLLACVSMDVDHTLYVYDWRKNICLFSGRSFKLEGTPPQVFGITWNPIVGGAKAASGAGKATPAAPGSGYEVKEGGYEFVTFGVKHIKVWRQTEAGAFKAFTMKFAKCNMQHVVSAAYLAPRDDGRSRIVTGHPSGDIYVWNDDNAVRAVSAHKTGPAKVLSDGTKTHHGVRLVVLPGMDTMVSSGGDGTLQAWDVSKGSLKDENKIGDVVRLTPESAGGSKTDTQAIRSFDILEGSNRVAVGTQRCDVMEVSLSTIPSSQRGGHAALMPTSGGGVTTFIDGHEADLYSIEWHPTKPNVFATACESSRLFVFDAQKRVVMKTCKVGFLGRACAWSSAPVAPADSSHPNSHHLAIGGKSGKVKILAEDNLQPLYEFQDLKQPITDMKYSPNNKYLAIAGHDTYIDIYNVAKNYQRGTNRYGVHSIVHVYIRILIKIKFLNRNADHVCVCVCVPLSLCSRAPVL